MRMWRVCTKGMEKLIADVSILEKYQNRQVVINYYVNDDFLVDRVGFHFMEIHRVDMDITFIKKNDDNYVISLEDFPFFSVNEDFQNYFMLQNGTSRIEIYFP